MRRTIGIAVAGATVAPMHATAVAHENCKQLKASGKAGMCKCLIYHNMMLALEWLIVVRAYRMFWTQSPTTINMLGIYR